MANRVQKIVCLWVVFTTLVACSVQNRVLQQARVQDRAGMYDEAANLYYNVLLTDAKNKEAKLGLQSNGQKVIADKFAKFSKLVIENRIEEALKTYKFAQGYANNAHKVGVKLEWPHEYDEVYIDIVQEYTKTRFDDAIRLMQNRKYDLAEKVFEHIAVYDSSYKNVSVLRLNTVLEPLYNQGLNEFNAARFREAYFTFNKIVAIDETYKDAEKLRAQSLQKATLVVGVMPVNYIPKNETSITALSEKVAGLLAQKQGAYVRVASVQALHTDMQNRGFKSPSTLKDAVSLGKSLNLGYVLMIQTDSFYYQYQPVKDITTEAFEAVNDNILNPYTQTYSTITRFKKTSFIDRTESQQVFIAITYTLVDVNANELIWQETLQSAKNDELHTAITSANPSNLYPQLPEGNYLPQVSEAWRDMFANKNKKLQPKAHIIKILLDDLAVKVTSEINQKLQ